MRRIGERREVDRGLQERAHGPRRVERAVESAVAHVAPADQRLHFARLGVGDHDRAFQARIAEDLPSVELRELALEDALGRALHARVQRGEDPQALGAQVGFVVVAPQLPVNEVEEGRVGRSAHRCLLVDAEAGGPRLRVLLHRGEAPVLGLAQHEVSPLERALRIAERVVECRALHHAHEERALGEREVLDRLAEVVERGEAHAVDRAVAVLAKVDFVQIRLEDLVLVVVDFQQHRHEELGDLARERTLGREEEVLHQLLRQRAAALESLQAEERDRRARDAAQVEAVVRVEIAVLVRDQRLHQVLWHLGEPHQHAVLVVRGIDSADGQRLQARERQVPPFGVLHRLDRAAFEGDAHALRGLQPVPEHERPHRHLEPVVVVREPARIALARALAVARLLQLAHHVDLRDAQARVQLERPRINPRRQREAAALELAAHAHVEIQREGGREQSHRQDRVAGVAPEFSAIEHRRILLRCGVEAGERGELSTRNARAAVLKCRREATPGR